eukprot:Skav217205  [mRNA]  locus=scaffold3544:116602:118246:+ [translate_table: standard]
MGRWLGQALDKASGEEFHSRSNFLIISQPSPCATAMGKKAASSLLFCFLVHSISLLWSERIGCFSQQACNQRANAKNPNNPAYKKAQTQRANSKNPNHPSYNGPLQAEVAAKKLRGQKEFQLNQGASQSPSQKAARGKDIKNLDGAVRKAIPGAQVRKASG